MSKLDDLIKKMNKNAQEEVIGIGLPEYNVKRIPFTSPRMNWCTFGGLPIGKLIEFSGEEHSGKTTTALDVISNYQRMEGARKVLYIDAENTLDTDWATKLGVKTDEIIMFNPTIQSAEEIFQFILDSVNTGEVGLWVLDSIPALSSKQELERELTEKTYAGISGPLTAFSRQIEKSMRLYSCTGIGINQMRDDLSAMYAGATKTPGGKGWKHFVSVRLEFSRGKFIDENGNDLSMRAEHPAGNYVLMSMKKNKYCPPSRRTGFYTLRYDTGIDYLSDLVDLAIYRGIIEKSGAWYSIVDSETGELLAKLQGSNKVFEYLSDPENENVLTAIETLLEKEI